MKINEFMCQDVCFVKPDCKIYDVARIMNENHVGCIPICNEEKNVVGVLTDRDIVLRSVASDKNAKTTPVSEIMTTNVYTCKSEQDIEDAPEFLNIHGFLCFEIGYNQKQKVKQILEKQKRYINIYCKKDLCENDRVVVAQLS